MRHVHGDLITLPEHGGSVPLPWHCRAPLGLASGVPAYASLVGDDGSRRIPDLIVSVLKPANWHLAQVIRVRKSDGSGLLHEVVGAIGATNDSCGAIAAPINIALGESTTVSVAERVMRDGIEVEVSRRVHEVTLVCEPSRSDIDARHVRAAYTDLAKRLADSGWNTERTSPVPCPGKLLRPIGDKLRVEEGSLLFQELNWRKILVDYVSEHPEGGELLAAYDLGRAVVSSDLNARIVRFVFPKQNAARLETNHPDVPNVLLGVTRAVQECGQNILGSYLRIGGTGGSGAKLVAIAESEERADPLNKEAFLEKLRQHVSPTELPTKPQISISAARPYRKTLFPKLPPRELLRQLEDCVQADVQSEEFKKVRCDLLVQALRACECSAVDASALRAMLDAPTERGTNVFFSSGAASQSADAFDRWLATTLRDWAGGEHLRVVPSFTDMPNHALVRLADRLPALLKCDKAVFVLRERDGEVNFQPVSELSLFNLFGPGRSSLLLVQRSIATNPSLPAEWSHSVSILPFDFPFDSVGRLPHDDFKRVIREHDYWLGPLRNWLMRRTS